jgi:hypothetical protein
MTGAMNDRQSDRPSVAAVNCDNSGVRVCFTVVGGVDMWTAGVVAVALVASAACALADSQCYSATGNDVRVEFVDRCSSPLNDGRNRSIRISASRGEQSLASTRLSCPRRRFKSLRRRSVPRPWWTASSKVRGVGVHDHDVCSCRSICFVEIGLSDFKGKYLVLFFYPMDLYVGRGTSECSVVLAKSTADMRV